MRWTHYVAAVGLFTSVACGSNDDSDFENVVPSAQAVTVNQPGNRSAALTAGVGEISSYYVITRVATVAVNSTIVNVLALVHGVSEQKPTTVDGNTATWGPGSGDALDPNVYQLVATGSGNVYDYHFDYRAKADTSGAFTTLIQGHSDTSGNDDGKGTLTVHATAFAAAQGKTCGRGDVVATYDTTKQPQTLAVTFDDFRDCDDDHQYNATYNYDRSADGSGNFEFATQGDIQEGARQPVVNEDLVIRSRWNATGAGRSDARISGGDLSLEGAAQVTASECWNASFDLTFAITDPQLADLDHATGDVSACPAGMSEASPAVNASVSL